MLSIWHFIYFKLFNVRVNNNDIILLRKFESVFPKFNVMLEFIYLFIKDLYLTINLFFNKLDVVDMLCMFCLSLQSHLNSNLCRFLLFPQFVFANSQPFSAQSCCKNYRKPSLAIRSELRN